MEATIPALSLKEICKSFNGVEVLHGISMDIPNGRTLGLVGENGAGKSTMLNILGGQFAPSSGQMELFGECYSPQGPQDTRESGIAFIHQELNLFDNLSIEENFFISDFPKRRFLGLSLIDRARIRRETLENLLRVGIRHEPDTLVGSLAPGEKQLVEIAKALSQDARIILFDEPTTSLTSHEAERLFRLIRELQGDGLSLVYISHNLKDVLELSDEIAVLRDGNLVSRKTASEMDEEGMIKAMVGRSIDQLFPQRIGNFTTKNILEARNLSTREKLKEVSFKLQEGEILGLFGLIGAGRTETARALFGVDPTSAGEIYLKSSIFKNPDPRKAMAKGMAFVTEDRKGDGLCLPASVSTNMTLASFPELSGGWWRMIDLQRQTAAIKDLRKAVHLDNNALNEQTVSTLSGGNQQKVVLGRWLHRKPAILILDEPTRGVDIGAKELIYRLIVQLADEGTSVLLISSEIEELLGLSDRILVMKSGRVRKEILRKDFDREVILEAALGG